MSINTSQGSKIYVGPVSYTEPASVSAYAALSYTEIGSVESIGAFGDKASSVTFADLSAARVKKFKGVKDAGQLNVSCAHDPLNTGQIAMIAARNSKFDYAFKVTVEDKADANDTNSAFYFLAKVMSADLEVNDVNSMLKRNFTIDINSAVTESLSVATP